MEFSNKFSVIAHAHGKLAIRRRSCKQALARGARICRVYAARILATVQVRKDAEVPGGRSRRLVQDSRSAGESLQDKSI